MKSAGYSKALRLAGVCLGVFLMVGTVHAEDLNLKAQLIWGTNDKPAADSKDKPVDPALAKKLSSVFKWKYYYEVSSTEFKVPSRGAKEVTVSSKCKVVVKELEGPQVEVQVFGEGKHVKTVTSKLTKEETLTIAGDDKKECAWFIYFQQF
ncbi:MAG: hypothetical protein H7X97_10060 [Opitutaceae bacterium]|nr:hypothetical protein [Verrucomicrobiales bacterium]